MKRRRGYRTISLAWRHVCYRALMRSPLSSNDFLNFTLKRSLNKITKSQCLPTVNLPGLLSVAYTADTCVVIITFNECTVIFISITVLIPAMHLIIVINVYNKPTYKLTLLQLCVELCVLLSSNYSPTLLTFNRNSTFR